MTIASGAAATPRVPYGRVAIAWAVLCAVLVMFSLPGLMARRFPDPDDVLRLVQVRDLLHGQGWFDLHQYRIDGPKGTLMHWSRLVDAPLAILISALTPILGSALAEQVTLIAVPLLTLAAILLVVARLASRFFDREGVTFACLCAGLAPLLMAQVQPMRIDHHGWQIFTVMLAMTGLLPGRPVRGGIIAGAALALGLSISLEILPIAAVIGAVLALRWLTDDKAGQGLVVFLATLAAGLAVLFLATRGFADLANHCDAIAPAHLMLFGIVAAGAGGVLALRPRSFLVRGALLALVGAVALALYLWVAPDCAAGPFGSLDPLVRAYWYNNIREGRPAWEVPAALWIPVAIQGVIALLALVRLWRGAEGVERRWWFEYLLVTAATFIVGLLVWRSLAFVGALSALPLGWLGARLLGRMSEAKSLVRKLGMALLMVVILVPGFPVAMARSVVPEGVLDDDADHVPAGEACDIPASAPALNRLPVGTVFAPLDLGPVLLEQTRHSVVASSHHRAAAAMHDVIASFIGSPDAARALMAKHHARYVLICTDLTEFKLYANKAPQGFAADLAAGRAPGWLEPIAIGGSPSLRVWRVAG